VVGVTNLLFICSQNKLRSPTAEQIFADWPGVEADSAGLNNDAVRALSAEQIAWAHKIFVMEKAHMNRLRKKFSSYLHGKKVYCLNIPDEFEYMQPELQTMLKVRVGRYLIK
jgi:predicted protein tyrosine phosphatase